MFKLLLLFICASILSGNQAIALASTHQPTSITLLINQEQATLPFHFIQPVKAKLSLKERILAKWYKKQLRKRATLDQPKKTVNTLGYISLIAGVLAPVLILITSAVSGYGFALFLGLLILALIPTAIVLGILSLSKRKKLTDKSGTSPIPAILGLVAGSLLFLLFIIALISFTYNYTI